MKEKLLLLITLYALNSFSQSGIIDSTFGINGKTVTGFGSNRNSANAVAFQLDGKVIVGGNYISNRGDSDFALARFNSDGSLDASFGADGKVVTNFLDVNNNYSYINSVYVLPDGKIMALGTTGKVGFLPTVVIIRYNNDGTLDYSFGTNGKVISELIPFDIFGNKLVFQPDGKFIITSVKRYNFDPNYYFGVERYTADGFPDATFGTNGQVVTSFGNGQNIPASMALQADGKIVVTGKYMPTNVQQLAVARFTTDGILDTSFDGDGKIVTSFGSGSTSQGMQVMVNPNGKIIVAGIVYTLTRNFGLVQYNVNGSLDTTFDGDGKAVAPFADNYDSINSIIGQPDGKFLVVVRSDNFMLTSSNFVVRRYNSDISVDTFFGINGEVATPFNTGLNEAQTAGIMPEGKIVVVGESIPTDYGHIDFGVAQYTANGTLDTTFDTDGKQTVTFEKGNDQLSQVLVQPDDTFIAVGTSGYTLGNGSVSKDIVLSRYNSDGNLDTTFGNSGKVVSIFGQNINTVSTAVLQTDGKILVGNQFYNQSIDNSYHYEIIRYLPSGSLDASFGSNGKVGITFNASSIVIQPDGKIVIAGSGSFDTTTNGYVVNRLNANGTFDTGFDNDGIAFVPLGNSSYGKISALLQPDGKIVVSGSASNPAMFNDTPAFATARLTPNGSLDTSFGDDGEVWTLVDDISFESASFIQPDGKLLIAGISHGNGIFFSTVQYNTDGTTDATYGTNGVISSGLPFDYRLINTVLLQSDGKILVALTQYNQAPNTYDFKVKRFNPDGTYDDDFGGSNGITTSFYNGYDEAFSMALQSDNKIIVGGTTHNGINNDFALTRYTNTILSVPNFNAASNLVIYPNPVKNILNIRIPDGNPFEIQECAVYNMLGQLICKTSGKKTEIDTGNFSRGMYTIQIKTTKGQVSKKFIRE